MTDLEMTKLCAEAMEISVVEDGPQSEPADYYVTQDGGEWKPYDPLHDDAQAMALLSWLVRYNQNEVIELSNHVFYYAGPTSVFTQFGDFGDTAHLRRAIVECVAKMQAAKRKEAA